MAKPKCSEANYLCKGDKGFACIPKTNQCNSQKSQDASNTLDDISAAIDKAKGTTNDTETSYVKEVTKEQATKGLNVASEAGRLASLGGVAAEIGMIQEINKQIGKEPDQDAEKELASIRSKLGDEATDYRVNQAKSMVDESLKWAKENGYDGNVTDIIWTAKPGALAEAGFPDIPQKRHPADVVLKFDDGKALGISAKSSTTNSSKLTYKNRGLTSLENSLGLDLDDAIKEREQAYLTKKNLTKPQLRSRMKTNKALKKQTDNEGRRILKDTRDRIVEQFSSLEQSEVARTMEDLFLDTENFGLPYIKTTGLRSQPAKVVDPLNNPVIEALRNANNITFEPQSQFVVKVKADGKNVMDISPKYGKDKVASSILVIAR